MSPPSPGSPTTRRAFVHIDLDGLSAICRGHGRQYLGEEDRFFATAMENALEFLDRESVRATLFVIAEDLDDPDKRGWIDSAVRAGHRIGCHGLHHRYLDGCSDQEQEEEIAGAKAVIEDRLGVSCEGFRAPGYSIDYRALCRLRDAGYRYDSSMYPTFAFRERTGIQRIFPEPFALWPEDGFFEVPLPASYPGLPAFHPCISMYLGHWYFRRAFWRFARRHNYYTLLLHLTDFAAPQPLHMGAKLDFYTNNRMSATRKLRFLRRTFGLVRREYEFTSTETFLDGWPDVAPDLNPRVILGISTTHETGACVVRDGVVLSAVNEERLSRKKLDAAYPPVSSIREAIRVAAVDPSDIAAVAIAGLRRDELLPQLWKSIRDDVRDYHSLNDYVPHLCRLAYRMFYLWRAWRYESVRSFLVAEYGINPKVFFVEHHEAHASSVYRTGSASRALVVTADGVGDEVSITFSEAAGSLIRRLTASYYPHSLGQFYTACTQVLGFKGGRHEGKITGLSGYGRVTPELLERVQGTLMNGGRTEFKLHKKYYAEGFIRPSLRQLSGLITGRSSLTDVEYRNYKPPLKRLLQGYPREDVAAVFQELLEREMQRLVDEHWRGEHEHLALAGGIFANVKLNMAMSQGIKPQSIYIFPNMGDGGLGVGAALSVTGTLPRLLPNVYLGTVAAAPDILAVLQAEPHLTWETPPDLATAVAELLAAGMIVGRASGAMEYGPRALGNRSILYHCADPSVNDWLNRQLGRTEFMPFAPMCLWEDAEEYFVIRPGEKRACEFMTLVVRCTERMQQECPAAVHVDGTARPQLIREDINPEMYRILLEYRERTGISCVINTSFNMHEEPIVRTPSDAVRAFKRSHLDHLVMGPYLVSATDEGGDSE